ncbi:hypothetical protein GFS24_08815 [Chitinophaga sp. SYP-B3965]|uniref:DUF4998 domain-containing protein n=1 Tax=Chitinophaga sp. SYP-B3965 TaxID=2663120 RepID=UPI001299766B|nr:DUF4998 domain-containing protein [Chitinophaga sp. SYP-B3965]MRG45214.1 hypothetical protein [Chitinophaga sp. SYP-B3965]
MKRSIKLLLFISCIYFGCNKGEVEYRDLLGGEEIIYPGLTSNFKVYQGNLRVKLQWNPSPDPSITKYMIYWNNNEDSLSLPASSSKPQDTISTMITGISEYVQNFVLYTYDNAGNRSIGQSLSGVRIYGPLYVSSLVNRQLDAGRPPVALNGYTYKIYFSPADTVLNTGTTISYLDSLQNPVSIQLRAKTDSTVLDLAKAGTKVAIRSYYVPVRNAVDTFRVTYSDTLLLK